MRRMQFADGRTRAFVNDQPVSVQVLRALGAALVEIHGQHDERAFVDAATHRALLDAYGGIDADAAEVARLWDERRAREAAVERHRADVERAKPRSRMAAPRRRRARPPQPANRRGDGAGRTPHRHDAGGKSRRRFARHARRRQRAELAGAAACRPPCGGWSAAPRRRRRLIEPAVKAIDAALTALEEARAHLEQALRVAEYDPAELERIEERLFALRAAGRKYNVPVDELAALARRYDGDLALDRRRRRAARRAGARSGSRRRRAIARRRKRCRRRGGAPRRSSTRRSMPSSSRSSSSGRNSPPRSKAKPKARTASTASNSGCAPIPARGPDR